MQRGPVVGIRGHHTFFPQLHSPFRIRAVAFDGRARVQPLDFSGTRVRCSGFVRSTIRARMPTFDGRAQQLLHPREHERYSVSRPFSIPHKYLQALRPLSASVDDRGHLSSIRFETQHPQCSNAVSNVSRWRSRLLSLISQRCHGVCSCRTPGGYPASEHRRDCQKCWDYGKCSEVRAADTHEQAGYELSCT
jgi:hypothetical protein